MKLKHTHRTDFARSDYDLAAIHVFLVMNGKDVTSKTIEDLEIQFRGHNGFEKSLRDVADWLEKFHPGIEVDKHECAGQMCDQDGKFEVHWVRRKSEE